MDFLVSLFVELSQFLRQWEQPIAVGFVATILVIFGTDIVHLVKEPIKKMHFLVRLTILILVAALGFSFLTNLSNRLMTDLLMSIPDRWFSVVVIGGFFALGIIAEKKKFM